MTPDELREMVNDDVWPDDHRLILEIRDLLPKLVGLWEVLWEEAGAMRRWRNWPQLRAALKALEEA